MCDSALSCGGQGDARRAIVSAFDPTGRLLVTERESET
jgi:hypothetical protein